MTVGGKNPKSVWWNDQVKAAIKRKEAAWKVLGARDKDAKELNLLLEDYLPAGSTPGGISLRKTNLH